MSMNNNRYAYEDVDQHDGRIQRTNEFYVSWPTTKAALGVASITSKVKVGHEYRNVALSDIATIVGDAFDSRSDKESDIVFDFIFDSEKGEEPTVKLTYRGELYDAMAFGFENPKDIPPVLNFYRNRLNTLQICCHDGERPIFWLRNERPMNSF